MRRQDFLDTVSHRAPHKIPVDFGGCPLSTADGAVIAKMKYFLGFYGNDEDERLPFAATASIDERILREYDIDTRGVGYILAPKKSLYRKIDDTAYVDEWGVTRKFTGLYWDIVDSPLKDAGLKDVENYPFPDPDSIDVKALDAIKRQAKYLYENTDYVICASHPVYGIFELGCWMFGFDDFLYRMAAEPEVVHCFFERVLAYQKQVSDLYYGAIGDYIHYTSSGDDFATQSSTFFSKTMFDEMILPYFKERVHFTKEKTAAKFLHHSCGNVFSLIPSLIEAGVDILNPIQPCSGDMAPCRLKETYGANIAFHGGLDTQSVLPRGNKESIGEAVRNLMDTFRESGGYIFAAAHNIQGDVSAENIHYFLQAAKNYK